MNRRVFRGPAWYPFNAPLEAQAASIPSKSSLPPDYPRPPRPASRYRRPLALIPVSSASSTITTAALCSVSLPSGLDPRGLSHQPLSRRYVAVARPRDSSSPPPPSREATETSTSASLYECTPCRPPTPDQQSNVGGRSIPDKGPCEHGPAWAAFQHGQLCSLWRAIFLAEPLTTSFSDNGKRDVRTPHLKTSFAYGLEGRGPCVPALRGGGGVWGEGGIKAGRQSDEEGRRA
ncbi:hypothetical protein THAOC_06416 [Thalassiosira oceanica]|uniref:Uncharacterized protein n=1 Tax=Thalassiosira oceanica TaxID=159749 RepID=K0T4M2_THAOC|nr:hypothetical protein THAOC_06416 [Thalassiosira oceanica]|eukprot:EJK72089.1 hypothetical protein THAOC_06416 [Thalassiosira oceanica]